MLLEIVGLCISMGQGSSSSYICFCCSSPKDRIRILPVLLFKNHCLCPVSIKFSAHYLYQHWRIIFSLLQTPAQLALGFLKDALVPFTPFIQICLPNELCFSYMKGVHRVLGPQTSSVAFVNCIFISGFYWLFVFPRQSFSLLYMLLTFFIAVMNPCCCSTLRQYSGGTNGEQHQFVPIPYNFYCLLM